MRLSLNVEKIIYSEKLILDASSFKVNDVYNVSGGKKLESSKKNFPISGENMSFILIRVNI